MKISEISIDKYKIISGSTLKLIAVIAMFIDHSALILCGGLAFFNTPLFTLLGKSVTLYFILRKIGRLAFPLFCFLVAEGFFFTKNPKKYALTLFIFALISEVPFNLMLGGEIFYTAKQNVYFTLLFGVLLLYILKSNIKTLFKLCLCIIIVIALPYLRFDYGLNGVLLIVLLYLLRDVRLFQFLCSLPLLSGGYTAWGALLLTGLYNGERGFIKGKKLKYAFYVFYPLHILILVLIRKMVY